MKSGNISEYLQKRVIACRNTALHDDFCGFIARAFNTVNPGTEYLHNWHIELIAEYLEACRRGQLQRLIINMPPRSLKSLCVSIAWPAFLLGRNSAERIIVSSYAASLSMKHSLDTRLLMQSEWYKNVFPSTVISRDQNEKHKFITTQRGYRLATSVGGSVTGEGGNYLIVDDPLNPSQAYSNVARNAARQWFENTFVTRLDDKHRGRIVIVMQRLHAEDLSGYLRARTGWEVLSLPAIAETRTFIAFGAFRKVREAMEPLHERRENASLIERAKREMGSVAFAAQYQQVPLPQEGGMIKFYWFRRYDTLPENGRHIVQSWDTAIKDGVRNDASVCITFLEADDSYYVINVEILRVEYPNLRRAIIDSAQAWSANAVLIEDKASGQSLLQDLRKTTKLPLIAIQPKGDKVTRFARTTPFIEAGKIRLPRSAAWLVDFESELMMFPHASHDDVVDAFSQFITWSQQRSDSKMPKIRRL